MSNKEEFNKNKLVKGVSAQTFITILVGILNVVSFAFFSRLLSKEVFGYFAALNAIITVFQGVSEAGLGSAVIQRKEYSKSYFSTAFTLSLIISTVLAGLLLLLSRPIALFVSDETLINPLRIISLLLVFNSVDSIGRASMMRELNFLRYGVIQIISYIVSYGIGIIMAYNGYGLYSLVAAAVLNAIFTCILIFSSDVKIPKLHIEKTACKQIISFGGWLTASVVVNQVTQQLDKLVLTKWLSVVELGAYSRPSGFIGTISDRFNGIFDTVLFPILSKVQDDQQKIKGSFLDSISLLNSFSVALAAIFFFNAELIIQVFFGEEWLDITNVFRIISIGVVFLIDARLMDCFFRSLALVRLNFNLRFFCMFVMLSSLYIGSQYGIGGVAYSVVIANVISILIKMIVLSRYIGVSFADVVREFIKSLRPAVLLLLIGTIYILFSIEHSLIINIIFATIFLIVLLLEFIFFPILVSKKYKSLMTPYINKIKKRNEKN